MLLKITLFLLATINLPKADHIAVVESLLRFGNEDLVIISYIESAFEARAVSPKGAKGPMQLMPIAIKEVYQRGCFGLSLPRQFDVYNIHHNVLVGHCYFKILREHYKLPLRLAVAAYNLGPTNVLKPWPFETEQYVKKFFRIKEMKKCIGSSYVPPHYFSHAPCVLKVRASLGAPL